MGLVGRTLDRRPGFPRLPELSVPDDREDATVENTLNYHNDLANGTLVFNLVNMRHRLVCIASLAGPSQVCG